MIVLKPLPYQEANGRVVDTVDIEWFELDKKRMRKTSAAGQEVGFALEEPIRHGDLLSADDTTVLYAKVIPCDLIEIRVTTTKEMGRLCFELGNRHLSLLIEDTRVRVPYDGPTYAYLGLLGFEVCKVHDVFTGFTECHAHGRSISDNGPAHPHDHDQAHEHGHSHD